MDRKLINLIFSCFIALVGIIVFNKQMRINNSFLDLVFICLIIIVGKDYLKIAVLLTLIMFLLKTNSKKITEGFELDTDEDDKEEDDTDKEEDDDKEDEDEDEDKDKEDEDKDDEDKEKKGDIGTEYENDCKEKCKKSGKDDKECKQICSYMCPNPIKYNKNLEELNKFKKIMKMLNE
jgi:hypothetical protein